MQLSTKEMENISAPIGFSLHLYSPSPARLLACVTPDLLSVTIVLPFLEFNLQQIKNKITICVWLLLLSIMFLKFIYLAYISHLLLFIHEWYYIIWM